MRPFSSSNNMLRYQRDNDELRRENDLLRKELEHLYKNSTNYVDTSPAFTELVSLQRKRIEALETEFESTQEIYEKALKDHVSLYQLQSDLSAAKDKCQLLQQTIETLTTQYGKEIATLKTKLAEQNAKLLLGRNALGGAKTPMINKLGVPRKESTLVKTLTPISGPKKFGI